MFKGGLALLIGRMELGIGISCLVISASCLAYIYLSGSKIDRKWQTLPMSIASFMVVLTGIGGWLQLASESRVRLVDLPLTWSDLNIPGHKHESSRVVTFLSPDCVSCRASYSNYNSVIRIVPLSSNPDSIKAAAIAVVAEERASTETRQAIWSVKDVKEYVEKGRMLLKPNSKEISKA